MKQRWRYLVVALLGFIFYFTPADGLSALNAFNVKVDHLSGHFFQIVKNNKGSQKSSGYFYLSRPKYFKWVYSVPYQQIIVGDGHFMMIYDVDLKQVIKRNQVQTLGASPVAVLASKNAINKSYILKNDGESKGISYVLATPRQQDAGYRYIRIGFRGDIPVSMDLKDSFGNTSFIQFDQLSTRTLAKGIYSFIPPKGVDVLQQ